MVHWFFSAQSDFQAQLVSVGLTFHGSETLNDTINKDLLRGTFLALDKNIRLFALLDGCILLSFLLVGGYTGQHASVTGEEIWRGFSFLITTALFMALERLPITVLGRFLINYCLYRW